uniref:Uncharacterized protein n=1 Tax=Rhizophora mucronata TaxID=61149 RepID=A0A2P2R2R5_RHIMU
MGQPQVHNRKCIGTMVHHNTTKL